MVFFLFKTSNPAAIISIFMAAMDFKFGGGGFLFADFGLDRGPPCQGEAAGLRLKTVQSFVSWHWETGTSASVADLHM